LLLRELKGCTPAEHAEAGRLEEAFAKVQSIAKHVNEAKRQVENMSKLLEVQNRINPPESLLQPHRRLIREGVLIKKEKKNQYFGSCGKEQKFFFVF
jgi:hypothetical protein